MPLFNIFQIADIGAITADMLCVWFRVEYPGIAEESCRSANAPLRSSGHAASLLLKPSRGALNMIPVLLILATPAYTLPPGLSGVAGLKGCWRVTGKTLGEDTSAIARGQWHLGARYFNLQLRTNGSDPYEASITYGAGDQPRAIGSVFLDTTGGLYEPSLGLGELEQNGFFQRYQFSGAVYVNRFVRSDYGWRWTITEQSQDKTTSVFADYHLRSVSCRGMRFDY
ncbi:MAG: hypothetical protein ACT6R2_15010 [Blastomonas fulva]|uniref:hypothetical protein n=2 Tax=Pseudomonadota TaxID=1224 RepID=UPI00403381E3